MFYAQSTSAVTSGREEEEEEEQEEQEQEEQEQEETQQKQASNWLLRHDISVWKTLNTVNPDSGCELFITRSWLRNKMKPWTERTLPSTISWEHPFTMKNSPNGRPEIGSMLLYGTRTLDPL